MPIRIPHSAASRQREKTYARLILRIAPRLPMFEGQLFRTGTLIDEAQLHPTPDYPDTPLLLEYAGTDGTKQHNPCGYGGKRLSSIHILWRFDAARKDWDELARVRTYGAETFQHFAPFVRAVLATGITPASERAAAVKASARVLETLDSELDRLEHEGRSHLMSFLYDQFAARLVNETERAA